MNAERPLKVNQLFQMCLGCFLLHRLRLTLETMLCGTLVKGFTISARLGGNHTTLCSLGPNFFCLRFREFQFLNLALVLPKLVLQVFKVNFFKLLEVVPARANDLRESLDLLLELTIVLLGHFANLLVRVELLLQQVDLLGVELRDV